MYHILAFFHICSTTCIAPKACGAHDCHMAALKRRISTRGASLLAALVFVVILAGFATAFQSANVALNEQALSSARAAQTAPPLCVMFNGRQVCDDSAAA